MSTAISLLGNCLNAASWGRTEYLFYCVPEHGSFIVYKDCVCESCRRQGRDESDSVYTGIIVNGSAYMQGH